MDIPVDLQWRESSCARDLTALNFADSVQDYNIEIQSPEVFIPSKTYMRFVVEVSGAAGAHTGTVVVQPTVEQQIALAEGCIANCFTSAYFKAGNWDISYVSDNFPQASAVEMRTSSGVWNDRLGAYTQGYIGDRSSRVAAISKTTTGVAGNNALIGVNLNEGKEEIYRPTNGQTPDLATLEGKVNEAGITMAGGASIAAADVGSTLVVNGRRYVINAITGGQVNVGVSFADAAVGPPAIAATTFAATARWYLIRRNTRLAAQARNLVQVIWRPSALGIFRSPEILGPGKYRLSLGVNRNYQSAAVEYPYSSVTGYGPLTIANAAYSIAIRDVRLYSAVAKMRMANTIQHLTCMEFAVQAKPMSTPNVQFSWVVEGSTKVLYMFLQDTTAGSNPIIPPSVFRVNGKIGAGGAGVAPTGTGVEQNLTNIQVNYAGIIKPQSQWSNTGFLPGQNLLLQMYYQSLLETERDDDARGVETFDQWLQRGPLYCWRFERDSHNLATDVQTRITYDPLGAGLVWPADGGCNLFLVSEYRRQTEITRKDDQITNVVSLNI